MAKVKAMVFEAKILAKTRPYWDQGQNHVFWSSRRARARWQSFKTPSL